MPKETGVTVAPNKQLFNSPSEEYFTPSKKVNTKSKYSFTSGCPPRIENCGEAVKELPFRQSITTGHQMTKALGIGGNERSNFILVQSPDADGNYLTTMKIQQGKQVSYNAVNPDDLLKEKKNPEPIVWLLGLVISYFFTRNISEKNPEGTGKPIITKLYTSGKVKTPEMKLIPPAVPADS